MAGCSFYIDDRFFLAFLRIAKVRELTVDNVKMQEKQINLRVLVDGFTSTSELAKFFFKYVSLFNIDKQHDGYVLPATQLQLAKPYQLAMCNKDYKVRNLNGQEDMGSSLGARTAASQTGMDL